MPSIFIGYLLFISGHEACGGTPAGFIGYLLFFLGHEACGGTPAGFIGYLLFISGHYFTFFAAPCGKCLLKQCWFQIVIWFNV